MDGEFFQIWVSDDQYEANIEFEHRSKGFRWFFTFYLVFMAETDYGHKDSILLLDEPGLHLYIPQQEKLLTLFDKIAENNQLIYSTHSPFMIDSKNLERVRICEEDNGSITITTDYGRSGDDVVFPIQAHLGYKLAQTLFLSRQVLMVEGETDYLLLIYMSELLKKQGKKGLPENMAITFAGGNSSIRPLTSMMAPQGFEIVILLDSDNSGKTTGKSLTEKGFVNLPNVELTYYGEVMETEDDYDLESMIPSGVYRDAIKATHDLEPLGSLRRSKSRTLSATIKKWYKENNEEFDKRKAIQYLISTWKSGGPIPDDVLQASEKVFKEVTKLLEKIQTQ